MSLMFTARMSEKQYIFYRITGMTAINPWAPIHSPISHASYFSHSGPPSDCRMGIVAVVVGGIQRGVEYDDENWGGRTARARAHVQRLRACDGVFWSSKNGSRASVSKARLCSAKLRPGLMSAPLIIINGDARCTQRTFRACKCHTRMQSTKGQC